MTHSVCDKSRATPSAVPGWPGACDTGGHAARSLAGRGPVGRQRGPARTHWRNRRTRTREKDENKPFKNTKMSWWQWWWWCQRYKSSYTFGKSPVGKSSNWNDLWFLSSDKTRYSPFVGECCPHQLSNNPETKYLGNISSDGQPVFISYSPVSHTSMTCCYQTNSSSFNQMITWLN